MLVLLLANADLENRECVKIDHRCGERHQRRVETVEHSAVTGQDVARILDADGALEERLNKVAPCAEEHNHEAQAHPLRYAEGQFRSAVVQRRCLVETNACCNSEYKDAASDASFPTLARTVEWR